MFLFTLFLISETQLVYVKANPIASNTGSQATVGWESDPNGRGTISLVLSCMLTLGLCVWSAIHLNIPPLNETTLQSWFRTSRWILLGILVPELVLFVAWRQNLSARTLRMMVQDMETQKLSPTSREELKTTMVKRLTYQ